MDATSYIAAAGMKSSLRALEIASNNVANGDSPGFKTDRPFYTELQHAHERLSGSAVTNTYTDFGAGSLKVTGNPLDLALNGDGFFSLRTQAGVAYTRNGSFSIGPAGELVTQQGFQVLDTQGQPIQIALGPNQPNEIGISPNGFVSIDGQQFAQLGIFQPDDPRLMNKLESQLFQPGDAVMNPMVNPRVEQGALEMSNTNVIDQMMKMMELQRMYELNSKVVSNVMNQLNQNAIRTIPGNQS